MSIGPKITIRRSCADCAVCQGERYTCQSDSGTDVYCAHPSFPQRRIIGDSRWDTPQWCPAEPEIAARADARIAELERECLQWRDELRIYRETENKRIAELERSVTVRDTEIARLETDLELARRDAERLDWFRTLTPHKLARIRAAFMPDSAGDVRATIDAARAGNGGEG